MLDIKLLRESPDFVKQAILKKGTDYSTDIDRILEFDINRRTIISVNDADKAEQNKASKEIPQIKKSGGDAGEIIARMNTLKEKIKEAESSLRIVEEELNTLMLGLPNIPDDDVPPGGKENNEP